jgi:hypothetical protein
MHIYSFHLSALTLSLFKTLKQTRIKQSTFNPKIKTSTSSNQNKVHKYLKQDKVQASLEAQNKLSNP